MREQQERTPPKTAVAARPQPRPQRQHQVCEALRMYAWDIHAGDGTGGEGGVTSDRGTAIQNVNDALADATPGASATVRCVRPPMSGRGPYYELGTEAEAHVDEATGVVVWK